MENTILHYGIKRKSGRYPWGSGEDPYQNGSGFLKEYQRLKDQGLSELSIANEMNITTTQLRNQRTWARKEQREYDREQVAQLQAKGLSNVEIGKRLGISEGTVRNYISDVKSVKPTREQQLDNIQTAIESGVNSTGYLDVGVGVERQLGISRNKFNSVVNKLTEMGYYIHEIYVRRLSDPGKWTTVKVLSKESDIEKVKQNSEKIGHLEVQSDDNAMTLTKIQAPKMVDLDRIQIRYAEDGGADKDGLIELKPGVEDLDMGAARYAQVRIGAGKDLYLKGMAAYTQSKLPDGVDIIFNTNKPRGTSKEDVLKSLKTSIEESSNPDELFGTKIEYQKGALNIVNEEGTWDTWSTKMSSQFLSKQPVRLVRERLDATMKSLENEYNEIMVLTNPVVKKHLLDSYIDGLDSKAKQLKAKGLPGTKNHVLLPVPEIKPNEIYAPNYNDGDRVALVRHPHGGIFEIPDLIVNNKNRASRKLIGTDAPDAVGIHPSVAEKLSGADFDGDTVLVIPNNTGNIKSSRTLKELTGWSDEMHVKYKRDHKTIKPKTKELQMGVVSNLITDMTIQKASQSEIAAAVKHSMVVIDSEKHNLDYKQSARDNNISALRRKYQTRINPETGKKGIGAATLISRSKRNVDISDPNFDPQDYSSGSAVEKEYVGYINKVRSIKNEATKQAQTITNPKRSKVASEIYAPEVSSLNKKLNQALLNAPRERQAQMITNQLYYSNIKPGMSKDEHSKLKSRSLAQARNMADAKRDDIDITEGEWEAIQARAISSTKIEQILNNTNTDKIKKLATPRTMQLNAGKISRAKSLLEGGYTYAEVAQALGVSTSAIRDAIQ